jgi:hypothetical protein
MFAFGAQTSLVLQDAGLMAAAHATTFVVHCACVTPTTCGDAVHEPPVGCGADTER